MDTACYPLVVGVSWAGRNFCYLGARFNSFHYQHPKITYYGSNKTSLFYPVLYLVAQSCPTLCNPMDCSPPGSSVHGDFPGTNTRMGNRALLQGLNPGLRIAGRFFNHLSHQESPRILEWVAYPFSRGSSQPRNRTRVSSIADGFFTS